MPTFSETLPKFLADPLWADQPFWLLNFFQFKRDADGSTAQAKASFQRYLSSAQRYAGQGSGTETWFQGARLVSTRCASAFPDSHGVWDAVVLYEYDSPKSLLETVVGNHEYQAAATERVEAEAATTQVAVKPTLLTTEHGGIDAPTQSRAREYADWFWQQSQARKPAQKGAEDQLIWPDEGALREQFMPGPNQRLDPQRPVLALNLLRYKRSSDVPDGRSHFQEYVGRVQAIIQEKISQPSGLRCCLTPCTTLNGETDWDEFGIMEYPSLAAFAGLSSLPGFAEAGAHRTKGLLEQGLVLAEPQLCNGFAEGPFRAGSEEDSKGLAAPHPSLLPVSSPTRGG